MSETEDLDILSRYPFIRKNKNPYLRTIEDEKKSKVTRTVKEETQTNDDKHQYRSVELKYDTLSKEVLRDTDKFKSIAFIRDKTNEIPRTSERHDNSTFTSRDKSSDSDDVFTDENELKNGDLETGQFPSYTAMIARAVLSTHGHKITLGGIYDYIEAQYKGLEKRVKGWRNCVRHNLSLNECFIKLGRSENGRGNDWTIHPNYLSSFVKGEYRKRRACMKKRFDFVWLSKEYMNASRLMPAAHCTCQQCTIRPSPQNTSSSKINTHYLPHCTPPHGHPFRYSDSYIQNGSKRHVYLPESRTNQTYKGYMYTPY